MTSWGEYEKQNSLSGLSLWLIILVNGEYINEPDSVKKEIPFSPTTFHMNTAEYIKSLPGEVHFSCFCTLALTPQKAASLYVHSTDLNNCKQNLEDNLNKRWKWIMFLMKYSVGKNLTVDVLVYNTVSRNGEKSIGSRVLCSSSVGWFSIRHMLKIFLVLSSKKFQARGIKDFLKVYLTIQFL